MLILALMLSLFPPDPNPNPNGRLYSTRFRLWAYYTAGIRGIAATPDLVDRQSQAPRDLNL